MKNYLTSIPHTAISRRGTEVVSLFKIASTISLESDTSLFEEQQMALCRAAHAPESSLEEVVGGAAGDVRLTTAGRRVELQE